MKKLLPFILSLLFFSSVICQEIQGVIYYQNSGGKIAPNVKISAFGCNSCYSNSNGMFTLECPQKSSGQKVKLIVDSSDGEGKNIEVVNTHQLEWLRIPDNSENDPIEIIVCYTGKKDEAALHYYGILVKSNTREYERKVDEIQAQLQKTGLSPNERRTLITQIDELRNERDAALEQLEEQAQFMASINQDQASDLVKSAIQKIEQEEDVEAALVILDDAKLEEAYQLALDKKLKAEAEIKQVIEGYELKISLLLPQFRYQDAKKCYEKMIEIHQANGFISEGLAILYSETGTVIHEDGKFLEALGYHQKAIKTMEETIEPQYADIAIIYSNVSRTYQALGDYQNSMEYQQKLIDILEKFCDPKSLEFATAYANYAINYHSIGRYQDALDYHQKSLSIFQETLDPKHPELALAYLRIASTYHELGDYQKALQYQEKSLSILKETLDPKHRNLAEAFLMAGNIFQALGDYPKALEYKQKGIRILDEILLPKHPRLANAYDNLAVTYQSLGDYEQALQYQEKSLAILEETLGSKHPDLATIYNNISGTYRSLGKHQKALEYQQKDISIREEFLDPLHPYLATSYGNLALTFKTLGDHEGALTYCQKAIDIQEEILDPKHPELANSYNSMGNIYLYSQNYSKALEYHQKAMEIKEEVLDSNHPELAVSYHNMASTYKGMGNYRQAIYFQERALIIFKYALPKDHPNQQKGFIAWLEIYFAQALDAFNKKDFDFALQSFDTLNAHNETAVYWNFTGLCHYYLANYSRAIEAYDRAASILPDIRLQYFYNNIGMAYAKNKQFKEAENAFIEYQKLFPNEGRPFRNWSMFYALQGDKNKTLQNLQKAVDLGYDDVEWLKTDDSMDSLRKEKEFIKIIEKLEAKK